MGIQKSSLTVSIILSLALSRASFEDVISDVKSVLSASNHSFETNTFDASTPVPQQKSPLQRILTRGCGINPTIWCTLRQCVPHQVTRCLTR